MSSVPELLAPAGDMLSLKAAVENGADAVYLGVKKLSARAYASNFSLDELEQVIDYAHLRGVKVYVTVNTLIKDAEFAEAARTLQSIAAYGADAVIVQDIGLLSFLRQFLPELPVHASTQMTVHNTESIRLLEELGVKRIVLARDFHLEPSVPSVIIRRQSLRYSFLVPYVSVTPDIVCSAHDRRKKR